MVAFLVRLLVLSRFSREFYFLPNSGDMKFYNDWAQRIVNGQAVEAQAFYGLPGYAYLLAAVYWIAGFDPFLVGVLQACSEGLIAVLIYQIAQLAFASVKTGERRAESGKREGGAFRIDRLRPVVIGSVAALGWTFFQPAQVFSVILMPSTWLVLTYWGCVWWILRTRTMSAWWPWFGMSVLIGVVAMMVATVLFLLPLVLMAVFLTVQSPGKKTVAVFCVGAGVFLGASPCWIHNYFIAKEPVFLSAHSGINFFVGNNHSANGYPKIPPGLRADQEGMFKDSIKIAELNEGRRLKRIEVSRFWSAKAENYIKTHFWEWLGLMALKCRNFWSAIQYDDLSMISLFADDGVLVPGPRFGVIAALGLPGMLLAGFRYPRARWVIAAILLHMAALLPVFITERYRLAAVPGLLLMGSCALWEFGEGVIGRNWHQVLTYLGATVAAVIFVAWPQTSKDSMSLDDYNTGIRAAEAGNLVRAQAKLEKALAGSPENAEIHFALGNLWLKTGDEIVLRAVSTPYVFAFDAYGWMNARNCTMQFYRKTIELAPQHAHAFNNLAVIAMQEERWPFAEKFLKRAVLIEPDDANTHYLLAKVQLEMGNLPDALTEVKAALRLKPERREFQELQGRIEALNTY